MDDRGQINEPEYRRFLNWLIEKGVHGLYPNGSSGEFIRLNAEERRRIIKIACEEAAGRVPVLAGAAEANVRETVAACETYLGYGAKAVAIVSPFYYRLGPESVYAYFAEIARNSPIDVTLYNIPLFASPIDLPTILRLAEFPRIVGIKDSSADLSFMMRMIQKVRPKRPDFSFLCGWEAILVPMIAVGADGGTNASGNVIPEVMRKMYDLARSGQFEEAMKWQYRILDIFDTMLNPFDFPDGFRVATEMRGFKMGRGRQPMTPAQQVNRSALQAQLQCLLADFGFVEPPAGGCPPPPPRAGQLAKEQIGQIVYEVLRELEQRGALWTKR